MRRVIGLVVVDSTYFNFLTQDPPKGGRYVSQGRRAAAFPLAVKLVSIINIEVALGARTILLFLCPFHGAP